MRTKRIIRQICLILSLFSLLLGIGTLQEQNKGISLKEITCSGTDSGMISIAEETISTAESPCTREMLGDRREISVQNVQRFLTGLRLKEMITILFAGLFLLVLILFPMAAKQYGFSSEKNRRQAVLYIHNKDGKKSFFSKIRYT